MDTIRVCTGCGAHLTADAPQGLCPQCLMKAGLPSRTGGTWTGGFIPPEPESLAPHFPQLEILELLGHGGMGAVYRARQRGLDRIVALKILPPIEGMPNFAGRFTREARSLARLNHPSIVTVHDFGQAGPYYYFLMEFVDGANLRQLIRDRHLRPPEALGIVPQICEALQYAHDEGVVHRDIKPENILLDRKGRVKIADFGLAKLLGHVPPDSQITGTGQVMGTPHYMAPEQFEKPLEVDHRADIYALGVVFYEMLTGEVPMGRFAAPSEKVEIDVRLDEVVLRSLEREPGRRYQRVSDVKSQVESITGMIANLPPAMRRAFGFEFRSKTMLWGLPLVHIATGVDPVTGRRRVATGIIAIGDIAKGFVASGGMAFGIVAFGGLALGIIPIGGVSFGVAALGGVALGLVFGYGGCAIAPIAVGGLAIGYYATGGAAFGAYAWGGNARHPEAREFFRNMSINRLYPWVMMLCILPPLIAGIVQWFIIRRQYKNEKEQAPPVIHSSSNRR